MFKRMFKNSIPAECEADEKEIGDPNAYIRMRKIVKTFKNAAGEFTVLKGINSDIYKGEFVVIIGKSGSGKSTLLNMLTGIDRPTSGEVCVGGVGVHTLNESQMSEWRGRNLGIVFQFFQLLPMLSLVENIMLPMDFCNMYRSRERRERAMQLLEMVEMQDHANKLPTAISGGQQQRVAIARSLANDPPVVVADEPTGNLDSKTADTVFELFEGLARQGKTIIMVTHDSSLAKRVSRTILIADGEIVNQYVAQALPSLTHHQMLKVTHKLQPMVFEPGATIIQQDTIGDRFYIVCKGFVEVGLKRPGAADIIVKRMGIGQYFGETSLAQGGKTTATVRAAIDTPVEVVSIDKATFTELMSESEQTREAIESVIEVRAAERVAKMSDLPQE